MTGAAGLSALVYALLAVTVVWMHYLYALVLVPQALYAFIRRATRGDRGVRSPTGCGRGDRDRRHRSPGDPARLAVGPAISSLSIPGDASAVGFAMVLAPPILIVSVLLGALLARMSNRVRIEPAPARSSTLVLLGSWLLFPVVTLYLVTALTPVGFPRTSVHGIGGAGHRAVRGMGDRLARARCHPSDHRRRARHRGASSRTAAPRRTGRTGGEPPRSSATHADPGTIVLLHPALVESAQLDWLSDPEKRSYLLSVQSYYPMEGDVIADALRPRRRVLATTSRVW